MLPCQPLPSWVCTSLLSLLSLCPCLNFPFALCSAVCSSLFLPFLLVFALLCLRPAFAFALICSCPVLFCLGPSMASPLLLHVLLLPASGCMLAPSSSGRRPQDERACVHANPVLSVMLCSLDFDLVMLLSPDYCCSCFLPTYQTERERLLVWLHGHDNFGARLPHARCSTSSRAFDKERSAHIVMSQASGKPMSCSGYRTSMTTECGREAVEHVVMSHQSHEYAFAHAHNVFPVGQGRGGSSWWMGGGPGAGGPPT